MEAKKIIVSGLIACIVSSNGLSETTINSASLSTDSLSESCIDYKIVGVCFWLVCTPFGCSVKSTPRISHYRPDFVVTSYPQAGETPYTEYKATLNQITTAGANAAWEGVGGTVLGGGNTTSQKADKNKNLMFFESDVVGHPLASIGSGEMGIPYVCPSKAKSLRPYFISAVDPDWRLGVGDNLETASWAPGKKEVGKWGNIYPRSGMITQQNAYRGAAVTAQRAVDIATHDANMHVRNKADGPSSNAPTDKWQKLAPEESDQCRSFGDKDDDSKISDDRKFAWNFWRKYECCVKGPGAYIGHVNFTE